MSSAVTINYIRNHLPYGFDDCVFIAKDGAVRVRLGGSWVWACNVNKETRPGKVVSRVRRKFIKHHRHALDAMVESEEFAKAQERRDRKAKAKGGTK